MINLAQHSGVLPALAQLAYVDIDSLLRPVYGHDKQCASFGHTKIAGNQVLRRGLSPLATTISTPLAAPVVAGIRLSAGKAGSGKGAASMVAEASRRPRPSPPRRWDRPWPQRQPQRLPGMITVPARRRAQLVQDHHLLPLEADRYRTATVLVTACRCLIVKPMSHTQPAGPHPGGGAPLRGHSAHEATNPFRGHFP
ncbi:hypothetical protein [Microlunatus parietis]|uniref:Uncharacterized protein n=1 Tax=Microlunatus parietis TaxID=682979 RepID=A0A7Y9L7X2_9ACTN|nr:hypothetical protein [Microlunatus parietis]